MADNKRLGPGELRKLMGYPTQSPGPIRVAFPAEVQEALRDAEMRALMDSARDRLLSGLGVPRHLLLNDEGVLDMPKELEEAAVRMATSSLSDRMAMPAPLSTPELLEPHQTWRKAWPEVAEVHDRVARNAAFYNQVLGAPYNPEDFQQRPPGPYGTVTGRMSWRDPPCSLPPRKGAPRNQMSTYVDSSGTAFTPETAHQFRDGHLINAVRKMRRENSGSIPLGFKWLGEELQKRGLLQVELEASNSLQQQAIARSFGGGPDGVRKVINELRGKAIHGRASQLQAMPRGNLLRLAQGLYIDTIKGSGDYRDMRGLIEDVLAVEFPILESDWPLFRVVDVDGEGPHTRVLRDNFGTRTYAVDMGDVYLSQVVEKLTASHEHGDIPELYRWLLEEFVRRGLHRYARPWSPRIRARHLPLISELEEQLSRVTPPVRSRMEEEQKEVLLSDLVKTKKATKENLFAKLREREQPHRRINLYDSDLHQEPFMLQSIDLVPGLLAQLEVWQLEELCQALDISVDRDPPLMRTYIWAALERHHAAGGDPYTITLPLGAVHAAAAAAEKEKTMSESKNMSLEEELAAHEARIKELKAELNKQKGLMGHPTAQMVSAGVIDGSKMLLATEAMDAVQALARKIALRFFIPEGHEGILETEQGQMFIDLSMPIAMHLAAQQGLFGQGSEFVAATSGYAFTGNWFKHGKSVTGKVKEVMGEFAGELNQLKELGKELMGFGQSSNMLSEVMDFTSKAEELASTKEKVEAKS